jgi:hypothetical protein
MRVLTLRCLAAVIFLASVARAIWMPPLITLSAEGPPPSTIPSFGDSPS